MAKDVTRVDELFPDDQSFGLTTRRLTRRDFLKLAGMLSRSVAEWFIVHNIPFLTQLWKDNGFIITGEPSNLHDIWSEVPPSLEHLNIPEHNPAYRHAEEIFAEGILRYESWTDEGDDCSAMYSRPANYITSPALLKSLFLKSEQIPERVRLDDVYWYVGLGIDILDEFDEPYARVTKAAQSAIVSLQQLVETDPGTGFVAELRDGMKAKYGEDFDIYTACRYGPLSDEQRVDMSASFGKWYFDAYSYVKNCRDKNGEPVSTSVLFSYFLYKNRGNILSAAWDTATWLKIICRNDPKNDLKRDPTYYRAWETCYLFIDEFSPTISANWTVDNVSPDDPLLNYVEDPYAYPQYKDFMPPNRAGGFYHAWFVIAMSLCIEPALVKRITASSSIPSELPNGEYFSEYGRVKSWTDMLVADEASQILRIAEES